MAIDYGTKRTGLAVTDPLKIIPNGLDTVSTGKLWEYLVAYFEREEVEHVIIGEPKKADGTPTKLMAHIIGLMRKLKKNYPNIEVSTYDERYSSLRAEQAIRQSVSKKKKRRDKGLIDKISAVIILQDYMQEQQF